MNSDSPELWNDPQTEARIVAWVLGEASDFEIAELEKLIEKSPELKVYHERTVALHGRLKKAHRSSQERWTLEKKKRSDLLKKIGASDSVKKAPRVASETQRSSRKIIPAFVWSVVITCAACVVLGLIVMPVFLNESAIVVTYQSEQSPMIEGEEILEKSDLIPSALPRLRRPAVKSSPKSDSETRVITAAAATEVMTGSPDTDITDVEADFGNGENFGTSEVESKHIRYNRKVEASRKKKRNRSDTSRLLTVAESQSTELASMDLKDPFQIEAVEEKSLESREAIEVVREFDYEPITKNAPVLASPKSVSRFGNKPSIGGSLSVEENTNNLFARKAVLGDAKQSLTESFQLAAPNASRSVLSQLDSKDHFSDEQIAGDLFADKERERGRFAGKVEQGLMGRAKTDSSLVRSRPTQRNVGKIKVVESAYFNTRDVFLPQVDKAWGFTTPKVKTEAKDSLGLAEVGGFAGEALSVNGAQKGGQLEMDGENFVQLDDLTGLPASGNRELGLRGIQWSKELPEMPSQPIDELGFWVTGPFWRETAGGLAGFPVRPLASQEAEGSRDQAGVSKSSTILALKQKLPVRSFRSEISASDEAFSTFSLNVSDVSFQLAQSALTKNEWPAPEKIRSEEFVNAFDYGDPAPAVGQPVACVLEQSIHPFLQQRNLFRIGVRTAAAGRASSVPLRLTLLIDQSGSMERVDRQEALQAGMGVLVDLLSEQDRVNVIGFSRRPRLLADRVKGSHTEALLSAVKYTPSEGGTNLESALKLAEEAAQKQYLQGAQNRIVLITDGAANLGNAAPEDLAEMIESLRQKGISFDACGVSADDLNDQLLEQMARKGDGRYYLLDRAADADTSFAKKLAGAFRPAAQDVKVQVVFNSERVGNYQLMGFEKHRLKKEDFRDNSINAAELAAEESGVALYHAEIKADGQGEVGEVFVRFRDSVTKKIVERSWVIPYESQPRPFDRAASSLQLAGIAAFAGEHLAGSPLADQIDWGRLKPAFSSIRLAYPANQRVLELEQMIEKISR